MKKFLLVLFIPLMVHSSTGFRILSTTTPSDPAYSADQPNITFDSLYNEVSQFVQLANWHVIQASIEDKKLERDEAKLAYDRGVELIRNHTISQTEFERREFEYKVSEESIGELENRAEMVRLAAESLKHGILMKGDPAKDLRRDIAQNMRDSFLYQIKSLERERAIATLSRDYRKKLMDAGAELLRNHAISEVEQNHRIRLYKLAVVQLASAEDQIVLINKAVVGMDRSLNRLFGP